MQTCTILRYPGGKTQLLPLVSNMLCGARSFMEPYAGGAGVGLGLLLSGQIDELFLNDFSFPVFCLWDSVVHSSEQLISLINDTPVSLNSWHEQKAIFEANDSRGVPLGFATLFLNRTNFSGVLNGRPIGGLTQSGKDKIDCRFNKKNIIAKIRAIAKCSDRIVVSYADGAEYIRSARSGTFLFVDPPYFAQGKSLYGVGFSAERFSSLADALLSVNNPFLLTLDDVPVLRDIFSKQFKTGIRWLRYSANNKRTQKELFVTRAAVL